jgi:hypothetical protein
LLNAFGTAQPVATSAIGFSCDATSIWHLSADQTGGIQGYGMIANNCVKAFAYSIISQML